MVIMAVDLGEVRTGLAVCDENETLAYPHCMIEETNKKKLAQKISERTTNNNAQMIVLGLPKNMDGSYGESALNAQEFENILKKHINIPVVLWDERQTTLSAVKYLNETNTTGKKRKKTIDTVAATIILENYLNFRKHSKNKC